MNKPNSPELLANILLRRIEELSQLPAKDKEHLESLATIIQIRLFGSRCIYCATVISRDEQIATDGYCYPHKPTTLKRGW